MSYLSSSENVGFSGIPPNLSEASCASQYKMAVEGVSGNCNDVNMFMHDGSPDDQPYMTNVNDNYFHNKFKIDPSELYTFNDSDVIAGEITVSHTEDDYVLADDIDEVEIQEVELRGESPDRDIHIPNIGLSNGDVKERFENDVTTNGHVPYILSPSPIPTHVVPKPLPKPTIINSTVNHKSKTAKTTNTKATKAKGQSKEHSRKKPVFLHQKSVSNHISTVPSKTVSAAVSPSVKTVSNTKTNSTAATNVSVQSPKSQTFLDVFKREQGLVESPPTVVKAEPKEPQSDSVPAVIPAAATKKQSSGKTINPKVKRGRGPAIHEALQRISSKRAVPVPNRPWHAPGDELFQCGPLDNKLQLPLGAESSSDDDFLPDIDVSVGAVCVEESAAESRAARLALRRAALRRRVALAETTLKLTGDHRRQRTLASVLKKQLRGQGACRLPAPTVNHLLATRGLASVLTSHERRRLRETGWSGGESGSNYINKICAEVNCTQTPVPCGRYCLGHVTRDPSQRLYAACAAVFADGTQCMQPLLPLQDHTPLCAEHAWKRDNYDKLTKDGKPKKPTVVRKRVWPSPQRPPRRPKRRRRPPPKRPSVSQQTLSDVNVCSNSSAYDSSEDTAMGALSETEYMAPPSHELEVEVGHVPPDDILDTAVLSQIPDEAFTEFFNQAEGGAPFAESSASELAAALEAVLDERALDSIADCVFTPQQLASTKIQHVRASVSAQPSTPS